MPLLALSGKLYGQDTAYTFPDGYLDQAEDIPSFWVTTVDEVNDFINTQVHRGTTELRVYYAGGRRI